MEVRVDGPGVEYFPGGLQVKEHLFSVPLRHPSLFPGESSDETITIFARECVNVRLAGSDLPWAIYLQGGPGFESPRPRSNSGWLKRLTSEYRVLLLDQRGTGRSTPVTTRSLSKLETDEAKAEYLTLFRQDSIVMDCEIIRKEMVGPSGKFLLYGQSYGGFCIMTYLTLAPEGISGAIFTGGIPPILRSPEEVYAETFQCCLNKNKMFYTKYPVNVKRVNDIVRYIQSNKVLLPNGNRLSVNMFRILGLAFYGKGGFETMHWLLEDAWTDGPEGKTLSFKFLSGVQGHYSFETNPIYAILHEQIYVQDRATDWAASRVMSQFADAYDRDVEDGKPFMFTGEMVFPWFFDEFGELTSLKGAAEILAKKKEWSKIYDMQAINSAKIPCAAAIYYEDMCVVRQFSEEVVRDMQSVVRWVTNEYEHNGSSVDGERIMDVLLTMLADANRCLQVQ